MNRALRNSVAVAIGALIYIAAAPITNTQTPNKATATTDVKLRQRMTSGGSERGAETVLYVKGPRMRNEINGGDAGMVTVVQCDLKRTLMINEKTRSYMVMPMDGANTSRTSSAGGEGDGASGVSSNGQPPKAIRGGLVNITNTITDTGERKEMFGFTARHIKTSMVKKGSPDACDKDQKLETDGWYVDFQYAFDCPSQTQKYQPSPVPSQAGCRDEVRTKTIGTAKLGFPLLVTTTMYQPDGGTTSVTQEVLELSRAPLDAALFEVPQGYTLAKDVQGLYGINSPTSASTANQSNTNTVGIPIGNVSSSANQPASVTSATTPKKAGSIRIGIIVPKVQLTTGNVAEAAEAVRNGFVSYLSGPTIEVVPLGARLPSLAMEEARQSDCDFVLFSSLTQKKGGGGGMFGRALGNIAGSAAVYIPGGGSAGTAAARSATIAGVYTSASIVSSIKARDEVNLEYKLEATNASRQGVANTVKAKASRDGEDIVTPLIEKASEAVVSAARPR
jgi:hypothetical protein